MLMRRTIIVLLAVVVMFAALSSRSSAIDKPPASKPATVAPKTGYCALPKGTVRIWDTGKCYGPGLRMGLVEWKDRRQWKQSPYGSAKIDLTRDTVLEGSNFYIDIAWGEDALTPKMYAKKKPDGTPSRRNKLYQVFSTKEKGYYHGKTNHIRVLKNSPKEAVVEYSVKLPKGLGDRVGRWRLLGGKPWVELTPVRHLTMVGMHGESRIIICPEAAGSGQDYAFDSLKDLPGKKRTEWIIPPTTSHMLLDPIMDDDTIWAMMVVPGKKKRFGLNTQIDGYPAGWSRIGEGTCWRVVSAPYAYFEGKKVVIGILRIGYWHYQKIDSDVKKGENFTIKWKYVYKKRRGKITSSPFKPNGPWWPMYAGKWRMVTRIDGKFHTTPITI
ncbi:MAG: hypothetical protein KAV00_14325, partial [Phycisphaerae bacterium]|nr:hypothetical protein [Phycisphaerae bacterium]